jgi:aspartate kinase
MRIVMKFGGTSVKDGRRIRRVANIVKERWRTKKKKDELVVVTSAVDGVTDLLVRLAEEASRGAEKNVSSNLGEIRRLHTDVLESSVSDHSIRKQVSSILEPALLQLERSSIGAAVLREVTPRSRDLILSSGERLSTPIVYGALLEHGIEAHYMTGSECGIVTDDNFGDAMPLMEMTKLQVNEAIGPDLEAGRVPIVTGYIASNQAGDTTTLGRGGSDFTATIIATSIRADEVWIWSDVDGLMTADPRIVPDARVLPTISYEEAAEMAVFGAKALHPRTLEPVAESGIPVRFRNAFAPEKEGTLVTRKELVKSKNVVKSIALVKDLAVITISGASMVGRPGSAARIFEILARSGTNILMISQSVSESNISVVVSRSSVRKAINALQIALLGVGGLKNVGSEEDVCVVAVVGAGMRGTHGIAAKVFGAVSARGINVRMIAQGSSEQNISFVVDERDGKSAVQAIHAAFRLEHA